MNNATVNHRHTRSRRGLRIRGQRGNPEVRGALVRFARWLRTQYDFPICLPIYLHPSKTIVTMHGDEVSASFFAPWDRRVEPYIRIATGDYPRLKRQRGRDNAIAAFICSLSHEIMHYLQWVESGDICEEGVAKRAVGILRRYEKSVDHP